MSREFLVVCGALTIALSSGLGAESNMKYAEVRWYTPTTKRVGYSVALGSTVGALAIWRRMFIDKESTKAYEAIFEGDKPFMTRIKDPKVLCALKRLVAVTGLSFLAVMTLVKTMMDGSGYVGMPQLPIYQKESGGMGLRSPLPIKEFGDAAVLIKGLVNNPLGTDSGKLITHIKEARCQELFNAKALKAVDCRAIVVQAKLDILLDKSVSKADLDAITAEVCHVHYITAKAFAQSLGIESDMQIIGLTSFLDGSIPTTDLTAYQKELIEASVSLHKKLSAVSVKAGFGEVTINSLLGQIMKDYTAAQALMV